MYVVLCLHNITVSRNGHSWLFGQSFFYFRVIYLVFPRILRQTKNEKVNLQKQIGTYFLISLSVIHFWFKTKNTKYSSKVNVNYILVP